MVWGLLAWNAAALFLFMTAAFIYAYRRQRLDTVDSAWGVGYVVVAWLIAGLEPHVRTILIAVLIDIWAIRLTHHIAARSAARGGDDPRYVALTAGWNKRFLWPRAYVSIFLLQGALILLVSLPTVFAAGRVVAHPLPFLVAGSLLWLAGFVIESIADRQLQTFIAQPKHKGKLLDTGLWRRSRHPNYLGEIMQWYGIGLIACSAHNGWIGLIGPAILNGLIRFVSGVPPIEKRKQKDPAYQAYMQRTNAIIPKLLAR